MGGRIWDCPFQMTDANRAETLLARGQVSLIRKQKFYGVPFTNPRFVSDEGTIPSDNPPIPVKEAPTIATQPTQEPDVDVWRPDTIAGSSVDERTPKKASDELTDERGGGYEEGDDYSIAIESDQGFSKETPVKKEKYTIKKEDPEVPEGGAKCDVCGKILKRSSGMKTHMRMHKRKGDI